MHFILCVDNKINIRATNFILIINIQNYLDCDIYSEIIEILLFYIQVEVEWNDDCITYV